MSEKCPVCNTDIPEPESSFFDDGGKLESFSCPRCGDFKLNTKVLHPDILRDKILNDDRIKIAKLSHWIRTRHESLLKEGPDDQRYRKAIVLDQDLVESILKNQRPSLKDQTDNFILWIGHHAETFDECVDVNKFAIVAIVGSATFEEFVFVFGYVKDEGLIRQRQGHDDIYLKAGLSIAGWERYGDLKRATFDSHKAFMAMEYGHPDLDGLFRDVLKPAVSQTGFELFTLPERPKAGLIDDRLRVEIQTSRFLIADLTHENGGAYWEAGYAEGLGRPVIYTCEEEKFEKLKTHFDTNHHLTIKWNTGDTDKLARAVEELKATIRATLPAEAKMTDD